jgi:hypothetical protein
MVAVTPRMAQVRPGKVLSSPSWVPASLCPSLVRLGPAASQLGCGPLSRRTAPQNGKCRKTPLAFTLQTSLCCLLEAFLLPILPPSCAHAAVLFAYLARLGVCRRLPGGEIQAGGGCGGRPGACWFTHLLSKEQTTKIYEFLWFPLLLMPVCAVQYHAHCALAISPCTSSCRKIGADPDRARWLET